MLFFEKNMWYQYQVIQFVTFFPKSLEVTDNLWKGCRFDWNVTNRIAKVHDMRWNARECPMWSKSHNDLTLSQNSSRVTNSFGM